MHLDGVHSLIKKAQEIPDLFLSSDDRLSTEPKVHISEQVVTSPLPSFRENRNLFGFKTDEQTARPQGQPRVWGQPYKDPLLFIYLFTVPRTAESLPDLGWSLPLWIVASVLEQTPLGTTINEL